MLGAAIKKDFWLLLRDRGSLIRLFLVPILFISLFGSMFKFGGAAREQKRVVAVFGDPRLADALAHSEVFEPRPYPSANAVREAVLAEEVSAGLIGGTPVELSVDLDAPLDQRGPLQGALAALVTRALQVGPPPAPVVVARSPGAHKPQDPISGFQVTVPANAVLFGFFIVITVALSFASEKRTGTWRRVLAAPVPRWKALVGTLVPYYLIGLVQLGFLFGIGAAGFGMTIAGSVAALVVMSMAVVLCAVCLGLAFASLGGSERQIGGVGSMVLLVMALLGGCMFPRLLMPPALQSIGHIVPHSWALDGYYAILVKPGTGLADVAPSIGALLGFAAVFATFGVWRFRFEK